MKLITTKVHGFLDYIVGLLLIAMPWLINIDPAASPGMIFIAAGTAALVYSVFTRYELGIVKVIPMRTHIVLDIMSGLLLAGSPWIFGFSNVIYLPHILIGALEILVALMTVTAVGITTKDN